MILTPEALGSMEKHYRANFVNSLSGFKSANLIGTISDKGVTNLALFSSVIHVGANPPLMGMLFRPVSVARHTYENIKAAGQFTINHVNSSIYKRAHQTSARYPDGVSEFTECGLTQEYTDAVKAPYVKEAQVKIGLSFAEEKHIMANDTIFLIGRIEEILLPDNSILEDGVLDIESAGTIAISSLNSYHTTGLLGRLPYAKPDKPLKD
ncbi:MAG: hypothetical protein FMNOHCHN_00176 [Ignavibacteriaceae bacterium]|nr:hypothetical protein [Ignavibacteriaceae bacterium]